MPCTVFVTQAGRLPYRCAALVRDYLRWHGLHVRSATDCPPGSDEGAVLDLIGRAEVLVVLQGEGVAGDDATWLTSQVRHAESTETRVVRVEFDRHGGRSRTACPPPGNRPDVVVHTAEPSESGLRSVLSTVLSVPFELDRDLSELVISQGDWRRLVDGARAAEGESESAAVPSPWNQSSDDGVLQHGRSLLAWSDGLTDPPLRSTARRAMLAALLNGFAHSDSGPTDARPLWMFVRDAVADAGGALRATVSAQGFYSVPLFSVVRHGRIEELLRLHVWPAATAAATPPPPHAFSVHSHQSHATSWVLTGGLRNRAYRIREWPVENGSHNLFSVSWDGKRSYSLSHRQSRLRDTGVPISVALDNEASFLAGQRYSVPAGQFHDTARATDPATPTATLFYFDATIGWLERAGVAGLTSAEPPAFHPKESVATAPLVRELDAAMRGF